MPVRPCIPRKLFHVEFNRSGPNPGGQTAVRVFDRQTNAFLLVHSTVVVNLAQMRGKQDVNSITSTNNRWPKLVITRLIFERTNKHMPQ